MGDVGKQYNRPELNAIIGVQSIEVSHMGVGYAVVPLDDKCADALRQYGIALPSLSPAFPPSPRQLITILEAIANLKCNITREPQHSAIYIDIKRTDDPREWTEIVLLKVVDDDTPCSLAFRHGSSDLVSMVVVSVAEVCGPQVVWPDTGEDPIVCASDRDR